MKASLQLRLGQQLAMTPQLRQAIRLLQLSALELQQEVRQALTSNVMLQPDDTGRGEAEDTSPAEKAAADDGEIDDHDWGDGPNRADPWSEGGNDFLENLGEAGGDSLQDHLHWQLRLSDLTGKRLALAEAIIDALDDDGYLREDLDVLADSIGISLDAAEGVLQRIQAMDPPGIAARDLRECLLAQLRLMPQGPVTELARQVVSEHLDSLARGAASVARATGVDTDECAEAIDLIQSLEPRPGAALDNTRPDYLVPDVLLTQEGNGWGVTLNSNVVPRLRLNEEYVRLLKQSRERSEDMQAQLQEARWLIRSLSIRNDTLLRVSETIIRHQQEYFSRGEEGMKPLLLKDVAEVVDLHESTVSRVTANKYIHTPRGTLPLKYFFSQPLASRNGDGTSTVAVRAMIRRLIDAENPGKPLSDQKIAARLDDQGIRVARRTVTKYREAMRIPASYARKSLERGAS
ncbi:MAG: RNA polymerase factor sigma-54 [Gammaproteobacteria bacterium]|nr:RNA polymerase factor sigma-54 [Gammaproteobacteria bacterium]